MRSAFLAIALAVAVATPVVASPPPIIVLVMLDGTRADVGGCLAVGPHVAPTVQRLCAGGVTFGRAYAQSSWAAASVASIMTGALPSTHGLNAPEDTLRPDLPTIASAMTDAGFVTAAFSSENEDMDRGMLRGFAEQKYLPMDDLQVPGYRFEAAERTALVMLDWVNDHRRDLATKGAFLMMHLSPARFGFLPSKEYLRRFISPSDFPRVELLQRRANQFVLQFGPKSLEKLVLASEAGIALADGALGLVLAELRAPELAKRMWIVVLASYGEARMEHGLVGHGTTLYDEAIRVPLVIVPPLGEGGGTRLDEVVELADVMPTILEMADVPAPDGLRGRSLVPAVDGTRLKAREAVSELVHPNPLRLHSRAVIDPGLQKTLQRQDGGGEHYDLRFDSSERNNLAK